MLCPGFCGSRHMVLSRISSVVANALMPTVMKLTSARLIGKTSQFHTNGDANHPFVDFRMAEMSESLRKEGMTSWKAFFDLRALFKFRPRRYRITLNVALSWFG